MERLNLCTNAHQAATVKSVIDWTGAASFVSLLALCAALAMAFPVLEADTSDSMSLSVAAVAALSLACTRAHIDDDIQNARFYAPFTPPIFSCVYRHPLLLRMVFAGGACAFLVGVLAHRPHHGEALGHGHP